jgi:Origin of replication binding protein
MEPQYDKWYRYQSELPPDWTYLIAKDRWSVKSYMACSSYDSMMLHLGDQVHGYEVIKDKTVPVWGYVDCDRPDTKFTDSEVLAAVRHAVESRMVEESRPVSKCFVSCATTPTKTSLHLKYRTLFQDMYALEAFMRRVIADVYAAGTPEMLFIGKRGLECVIDASVYSNFRLYRSLGMTKLNKNAPLVAVDAATGTVPTDDTMEQHFVKYYASDSSAGADRAGVVPEDVVPALGQPAATPQASKRSRINEVVPSSGVKAMMTKRIAMPSAEDEEEQAALCAKYTAYLGSFHDLVAILGDKITVSRVTLKSYSVYVCSIKKNCKHTCPYAERCHDSNNLFVVHNELKKTLTLRCHDEGCFHRKDVSFVIWDTTDADTDMWDRKEMSSMHGQEGNIAWSEAYSEPSMRDYPIAPLVCVRAGMGLGKTQALLRLAADHFDNTTKALIVTYSQALAAKLHKEFACHGFVSYKDSEGQIIDAKVVVCLDSLYRVSTTMFDYVFLDEAVSLFLHLNSPLMGAKTSINLSLLEMSVVQGKHVYFLDACMDHTFGKNLVDYFAAQKKCVPHWIHNGHVRKSNRHIFLDVVPMEGANAVTKDSQISRAVSKVLNLLLEGKNVVVCSSSKSFTVRLQHFIRARRPDTNMLVYNSDTSERLDDVATLWKTCQLLVYSPTITAGVSFELEHFDSLVAFVSNSRHAPTVDMTLQQLFRVRNLNDGSMHLFIHEICVMEEQVQYPQTQDGITAFLQSDIALASKYFSLYKVHVPGVYRPSNDHVLQYDTQRLSFLVIVGVLMMRNRSTVRYSDIMVNTLGSDYNIPCTTVSYKEPVLSQPDLDMLKAAPKKSDPVPWEEVSYWLQEGVDCDDDTLMSKGLRKAYSAARSLKQFMVHRWKTRDLNMEETRLFYEAVTNEEEAYEAYHRAARFVQACDHALDKNVSTFVSCVDSDMCDADPNVAVFKGRRQAYAMKVVIGQRYLMAVTDDQSLSRIATLGQIDTTEDACLQAYQAIVSDMSPAEHTKFCKLFDIKVLTGFMAAKKILGASFGVDVCRKDKKAGRKHYTTLLLQQKTMLDMQTRFGADLRRAALPTAPMFSRQISVA